MPRFHFNVHDGVTALDRDGAELADWGDARLEAVRLSGAILETDARRIAVGEDWRMEVTDETGLALLRLDFTVMASAATMQRRPKPGDRS